MATRLPGGPEYGFRTTDHSSEIRELRQLATLGFLSPLESAGLLAAADLLQAHDETGISLDDWYGPGRLVTLALGRPFLATEVPRSD